MRQAALRVLAKLPTEMSHDPEVLQLKKLSVEHTVTVAHLIYRRKNFETQSKDYEFSRASWRSTGRRGLMTLSAPCAIPNGSHPLQMNRALNPLI